MTDVPTAPRPAMPVAPGTPVHPDGSAVLPSRAKPNASGGFETPPTPPRRIARAKLPKKRKTAIQGAKKRLQRRSISRKHVFVNQAPKNPNRPLELKTQLANVLALLPGMKKPEVEAFTAAMGQMQALSRSGRRRVLTALGQVYP